MRIKTEVITFKPDVKGYKRIARELYPIKSNHYVHKNKKRFNKSDRQRAKQELKQFY